MTVLDSKKKLYKLLGYPYLNAYNHDLALKCLGELEKAGDYEYYSLLGTFLLIDKQYEKAKEAFFKDLDSCNDIYSTYYGLYRIALKEKDYECAYKYAMICDKKKTSSHVEYSLQMALVKMAMDISNENGNNIKDYYITDVKPVFDDFIVNIYYQKAIDSFNKKDIFGVRENILKICENGNTQGIPFNFYELAKSIEDLILLQKEAYLNAVERQDEDYQVSVREALNYINLTANIDASRADTVFELEKPWLKEEVSPIIINFLEGKISEKKAHTELDSGQFRFYKYIVHQIRFSIDKEDYEKADELSNLAIRSLDLPVFLYYKGKANYLSGKFDEAVVYLERYLEQGSNKLCAASRYLSDSYRVLGIDTQADDVARDCDIISKYFINLSEDVRGKKNSKNKNGVKNIRVNLSTLMSSDLTLEEYENYCFRQKIGVIAGLYCTKSGIKKADKLMSQLEKSAKTTEEKGLVQTVKSNKKLLINKGNKGFKN